MSDQPGLHPPTPPEEPPSPEWGAPTTQPPAYAVPLQYQQVTGTQTHQGALWSMILGIVGVVCAVLALPTSGITSPGILCSPVALGLGIWSSKAVGARPDVYNNRGHATAGWILGLVGLVLALIALLFVLAFVVLIVWLFAGVEQ